MIDINTAVAELSRSTSDEQLKHKCASIIVGGARLYDSDSGDECHLESLGIDAIAYVELVHTSLLRPRNQMHVEAANRRVHAAGPGPGGAR